MAARVVPLSGHRSRVAVFISYHPLPNNRAESSGSLGRKWGPGGVWAPRTGDWLDEVATLSPTGVGREEVLAALQEAKGKLESIG